MWFMGRNKSPLWITFHKESRPHGETLLVMVNVSFRCLYIKCKVKQIHHVRYNSASTSTREPHTAALVVSTLVLKSWLRSRHKGKMGTDLSVCSLLSGVSPTSFLGKLLQEAHEQPVVCPSCPQTHTSVTLKPPQNARHTHAHPCNPIYSKIRTSSTPSNKSADSLKYNMATGFTGWCSHKARAFSSPGKIPPGQKHDRCFRETQTYPSPASTQKQK